MATGGVALETVLAAAIGWTLLAALIRLALRFRIRRWLIAPLGYLAIGCGFATYALWGTLADTVATSPSFSADLLLGQLAFFAIIVGVWPFVVLYALVGD